MNTQWHVRFAPRDTTTEEGAMARVLSVELTQNKFAIVDAEDYENLIQYKWHAVHLGEQWYAATKQHSQSGVRILMHRFILGLKPGEGEVDHINGNGLDNRRNNIRLVTCSQNQYNRGKSAGKYTSKYKGVCFNKDTGKWRAYINNGNGKQIILGTTFETEEEAFAARLKAEEQLCV
jgi:AP2 domain/HNH endonuclease